MSKQRKWIAAIFLGAGLLISTASFALMLLIVEPTRPLGLKRDTEFNFLIAAGLILLIAWTIFTSAGFLLLRSKGITNRVIGLGGGLLYMAVGLAGMIAIFDGPRPDNPKSKQEIAYMLATNVLYCVGWGLLFVGGFDYLRTKRRSWLWLLAVGAGLPGLIALVILPPRKRRPPKTAELTATGQPLSG